MTPLPAWTPEQVLALAPDPASAKNAGALGSASRWENLGRSERTLWGECRGSAKAPYRVQVDADGPAYHCTCPSHKFPCKHSLGLMLVYAADPDALPAGQPPAWVEEWLAQRSTRAQRAQPDVASQPRIVKPTASEAPAAKRAAQRENRVMDGIEELERWMEDLVRQGLATAQTQPRAFWDTPTARLWDAQARGLAGRVKDLMSTAHSGPGWPDRLVEQLGLLELLLQGYRRLESLPPETQADLRALVGFTLSQEDVLAQPGQPGHWAVLGQSISVDDRLRTQRTWLWETASNRPAAVLAFAPVQQPLPAELVPGFVLPAELVFYPGAAPLRALVKQRTGSLQALAAFPGFTSLNAAFAAWGSDLAQNPWQSPYPMPLKGVTPFRDEAGAWFLADSSGVHLPLQPQEELFSFSTPWQLLAISGGAPIDLFGEWNGRYLLPLSAFAAGRFIPYTRPPQ